MKLLACFFKNESGATAIEYALIATGISLAIVAGVTSLGSTVGSQYSTINTSLK